MSPEVPTVLEGREETRQMEQSSTCSSSHWPHYRLPSSLQHLDQTELCSLSQLCSAHDIMKRKKGCMAQKNPTFKLQPRMAALLSSCPAQSNLPGCVTQSVAVTQTRKVAAPELYMGRADGQFRCRHTDCSFCAYFWEENTSQVTSFFVGAMMYKARLSRVV